MQRNILALALGASMLGAAALAACSGGGSGSSNPVVSAPITAPGSGGSAATKSGARLTLTINLANGTKAAGPWTQARARNAKGTRKPAYISPGALGLQVSVSSGSTLSTIYADINPSPTSPLCTVNGNFETCTLTIPTLAASENVTATEVDQLPTNETAGYGNGFPTNSNVLAIGKAVATITGGVVSISLGLDPVWSGTVAINAFSANGSLFATNPYPANFDQSNERLTVTAGLAQTAFLDDVAVDATMSNIFVLTAYPSPLPFADVNGSPEPITLTSTSTHVQVAALPSPLPSASPTFGLSAAAPNETFLWDGVVLLFGIQLDGALATPATMTYSTNLSAPNPFSSPPATPAPSSQTVAITVVPIGVNPLTAAVSLPFPQTTVTGSDYQASSNMDAAGAEATTGGFNFPEQCVDSGGNELASVIPGVMNTATWAQPFTISKFGSTTGTCTFMLYDVSTGTVSPTVTVVVN
jgi:hypothetical protein